MDTRTEGLDVKKGARPPKKIVGRQDSEGQEAVIEDKIIVEREDELVQLKKQADEAQDAYGTAIKKAAEDSGYNSATVRKYIEAVANDTVDAVKKKVTQLALIFGVD